MNEITLYVLEKKAGVLGSTLRGGHSVYRATRNTLSNISRKTKLPGSTNKIKELTDKLENMKTDLGRAKSDAKFKSFTRNNSKIKFIDKGVSDGAKASVKGVKNLGRRTVDGTKNLGGKAIEGTKSAIKSTGKALYSLTPKARRQAKLEARNKRYKRNAKYVAGAGALGGLGLYVAGVNGKLDS